jgi:hypothetical protein
MCRYVTALIRYTAFLRLHLMLHHAGVLLLMIELSRSAGTKFGLFLVTMGSNRGAPNPTKALGAAFDMLH